MLMQFAFIMPSVIRIDDCFNVVEINEIWYGVFKLLKQKLVVQAEFKNQYQKKQELKDC